MASDATDNPCVQRVILDVWAACARTRTPVSAQAQGGPYKSALRCGCAGCEKFNCGSVHVHQAVL